MKRKIKSILAIFFLSLGIFSTLFIKKNPLEVKASANGVSLLCDYENFTKTAVNGTYATKSNGNIAYAYILVEDNTGKTVNIRYHTVSGSALGGSDYKEVNDGFAYSRYEGNGTRLVRIAVETELTDLGIYSYQGRDYVSRSFFIVIDSATYDDGGTLSIIESSYSYGGTTFSTSGSCEVMLKAKNTLNSNGASGVNKLSIYDEELYAQFGESVDNDDGMYYNSIFSGWELANQMEAVTKTGLADFYAVGHCHIDGVENSEEETSRFIFGNDNWGHWGGASMATRGTGWFYGAEIKYDVTDFYGAATVALVENKNPGAYMLTGAVDNNDYVFYGDSYWFKNDTGPACAFSLYRHYACDNEYYVTIWCHEKIFDTTLPRVQNIYLDTTSLYASEGKYRVAVRFNEPVQNVIGTKILAETNTTTRLEFEYAGGEGSDTIFYDCDTSNYENLTIKRITFNNTISSGTSTTGCYINFRDITDFGGNKLDNLGIEQQRFDVTLDKRVPTVDVEQVNQSSTKPTNNPNVPLTLNSFTSGTVYYEWVKEEDYESYLGGNELVSFATLNKLKEHALDKNNTLASYETITNSSQDGSTKTQASFNNTTESGKYYLIVHAAPSFNITSLDNLRIYKYGTYIIDNSKPQFSNLNDNILNILDNGGFNRKFTFDVNDDYGIASVTALIKESNKTNAKVNRLAASMNAAGNVEFTLDLQSVIDKFYTNSDGKPTVNANSGFYDINFEIIDNAGNLTYVYNEYKKYYLSIQPYFDANIDFHPTGFCEKYLDDLYRLNSQIRAYAFDTDLRKEPIGVIINDGECIKTSTENEYFKIEPVIVDDSYYIDITFKKAGYFKLKFESAGSYSDEFELYVSEYLKEDTANFEKAYSNELLLVNKVFQLNDSIQFIYINSEKQIDREFYGGAVSPTFSSETAALTFLKYYEYQDMKYEVLTSNTASYLNTGSGEGYNKAIGETKTAMSGQVWIRYKRTSWDLNSESINDWAYYFYSDYDDGSNTIDVELLSENLKESINTICKKICSKAGKNPNASDVYLVDDEHLNPTTRAPYLTEKQIALSKATRFEVSKSGCGLANANYTGDPNLFENTIRRNIKGQDLDLPIATNMVLDVSAETRIFISAFDENYFNYVELKLREGITLKEAITNISSTSSITVSSNVYVLLELDKNGAREFYVYVDNDAPKLAITLNDETEIRNIDSREVANLFSSQLILKGIGGEFNGETLTYSEIDKYAYVALFKLPGKTLYSIYYRGEIPDEAIEPGSYLVNIGDRSGNFYSFIAYVSDDAPNIQFKTSENKIRIQITNRTTDDLNSVEIYCNDVLISTKLSVDQQFSLNGTYKIVIKDKYSTNEYVETKDFVRAQPVVSFEYDSDNQGWFSRYIEGNCEYMLIQNYEEYRLVSTSRRLKIYLKTENCGFEIKGLLPQDYIFDESEQSIEIKSLVPFYLDVWNNEQSEDIVSYKIVVDNYAPTIKITTDNHKLTFDETDGNNYINNDYTKPTSIKYSVSSEVVEASVYQDDNVTNDYVNVSISDETLIKEIKVYHKDALYKTYTKDDINGSSFSFHIGNLPGNIKVVVLDLFNNTTSFTFNFADKKLSESSVDGTSITSNLNNVYYGNDVAFVTLYSELQAHLMFEYNNEQVNQVYKFENGKLYVGNYTVGTGKYGSVDFFNGGKLIEGSDNQYEDKPVTLDINNTYKPFEDLELYIICDPLLAQMTIKLVADENNQKLTVRVNNKNTLAEYYEIDLSKEPAKLDFSSSTGSVVVSDDYVFSSTDLVDISYDLTKITSINVAFNPISNEFSDSDYSYTLSNMFENGEGYYSIKATNIYGTETNYYLMYFSSINASVELNYNDKDSETYRINYADEYYTNLGAKIIGYKLSKLSAVSDNDGSIFSSSKIGEEYELVVDKSCVVTLEDIYGNKKTIHIVVDSDENFKYDNQNQWINGFSQLSNKQDGFTNQKLSISLSKEDLDRLGIVQIKVISDISTMTLFGYDGVNYIDFDLNKMIEAIGLDGTGDYKIVFANKFGDVAIKEIHYSEKSSLLISRQTSSSIKTEEIDVNDALANGVWSNREIFLSSSLQDSKYYKFYVKADLDNDYRELSLPFTLALSSTSQNGTLKYQIKYVDAYGYTHIIDCNLNKVDIAYTTVDMDFITINQVEYTKDPINLNFDSSCKATYKLNSFDEVDYLPNQVIYVDGNYLFTIKDISGNVKTISFVKDSACKFRITTPNGDVNAYNGGVINANQLIFDNLGDTSYIKYVKFNGKLVDVKDDMNFTKTGLYELIIEDAVLNTAYFQFYLVNHSINEFIYNVPQAFIISEVYRTHSDIRDPYLVAVSNDKKKLTLTQVGKYDVILKNIYQDSTVNFSIEINVDEPKANLVGCEVNDVTTADISLKDVAMDDIVEVYKNGELVAIYDEENQESFKTITEGGKYDIVVKNAQGVSKTLSFTKKNIANTSLSILIIIILLLSAGGFFIGLLFRNRSKFDD